MLRSIMLFGNPKDAKVARREAAVLALLGSRSQRAIARELDISPQRVSQIVIRAKRNAA